MEDEIYEELKQSNDDAVGALKRELGRVRTGRASTALLEGVRVNYYGQPTPLNQVANLQVPEPKVIMIKPWEKGMAGEIEKAIHQANLGLNPSNDGAILRVVVPDLTEERRRDIVKQVKDLGETAKVSVRNARRDANTMLDSLEKDGDISKDDCFRGKKRVQDMTDAAVGEIDALISKKESEVMEI